ncbi:PREDICTED: UPF0669 protein C6orf120 homolog isoform X1 [Papilio xuthus]|uniref:UPF0669 protein C6orf120 homolog isoform X1 n=1 Tax=Papilio xuthus TaxID=66420 RepID=A0A0N0PAG3_PAPXU|nr:PREDICTED: UPF0669 protein C6orf120 homolog isoform X1 [Papilio xuthus]KPJ04726.1 UPF0669 protein C6orf120-like [Papilio xuthus]
MRREFILVLLGIICISTLSSLLSGYVQIEIDKVLLDTVVGVVGAGNFSYWQLGHTGPLLVELISLSGDADLYVADNIRPSYEIDKNNFSSVTCGPDIVNIPAEFPRPVGIGVFGHWSHSVTEYSIQVFLDTSAVLSEEQVLAIERAHQSNGHEQTEMNGKRKEKVSSTKTENEYKPRFLWLLNILDIIFDMFIL